MTKHLHHGLASAAVAALCLAGISSATAGSFTRGCAARDLQILMLIEERETANAIPSQKLSDAMLQMMEARMICHEGRVTDALAMYDRIAASLAPPDVMTGTPRRPACPSVCVWKEGLDQMRLPPNLSGE
jgi:hypothetical protein